jgi:hypothetical protein
MHLAATTRNPLARRTARIERSKVRTLAGLGNGVSVIPPSVGVPAGTMLTYVGTWQTTWTMRSDEVLAQVAQRLALSALPVRSSSRVTSSVLTDVLLTPQNFDVTLSIQATGAYAKLDDVISIIRHTVYEVTGNFPLADSIPTLNGQSTGMPGSPSTASTWSAWMQDNAGIIGVGLAAVLLSVALVKKF